MSAAGRTLRLVVRLAPAAASGDALAALGDLPGIARSACRGDTLFIEYRPREVTADRIRDRLAAHRTPRRRERFGAPLVRLAEAICAADEPAYPSGWRQRVQEAYLHRYRHRRHGRRDDRPQHWRQYLEPESPAAPGADAPRPDDETGSA